MARKRRELQLVDLCRIDTDKFKRMTPEQLKRVENKIGRWDDFTKAETSRAMFTRPKAPVTKGRHVNALVSRYVRQLRTGYESKSVDTPGEQETYERVYPDRKVPWTPNLKVREMYLDEANRTERKIWELQERAKCSLKLSEVVARDAERVGGTGWERLVAKIRKRPVIK